MQLKRGEWIRCERDLNRWPSKGTWPRYEGRIGRIITINGVDSEYGVRFTANHDEPTTWFKEHELVRVPEPAGAPNIRIHPIMSEG